MKTFSVIYEKDENGYFIASCPIIEGCYSQGRTIEEATINIKEAIELCLEDIDEKELPNANDIFIGQVVIPYKGHQKPRQKESDQN